MAEHVNDVDARNEPQETETRKRVPLLFAHPAPSGKYKHFVEYISYALHVAGSGQALGRLTGFTTGSRVTDWRNGRGGRPSITSCLKLAKITGDDPIDLLVMTGYDEEAETLQAWATDRQKAQVSGAAKFGTSPAKRQLFEARALLDATITAIERLDE